MLNTPFSPWPSFSQEEVDAISQVLLSNRVNYWTGEQCRLFEKEFAEWTGSKYAVALANGTVALDAALHAMGIGPGDEVVVTPRTFMASASTIVTAGATPVFAEVDRDTQNITADSIRAVLSPKTKAVICVHLAGMPCDMDPILELATERNLFVIEDCAQAHGATYKGRAVGSIGHVGAWSFCQDKIMTTGGEGGMVTTHDRARWSCIWSYKDHGKSYDAVYNSLDQSPGFRWLHESFGTNWRMIEIQAAIGRVQLNRMPTWTASRRAHAERIWAAARTCPAYRVPAIPDWAGHACYKCYVFVEPERLGQDWNRDRIMREIQERGVPCYSGSCSEVYLEKAFDDCPSDGRTWRPAQRFPIARELGETSLMFLVHPTLTDAEIAKTCEVIQEVGGLALGK